MSSEAGEMFSFRGTRSLRHRLDLVAAVLRKDRSTVMREALEKDLYTLMNSPDFKETMDNLVCEMAKVRDAGE